MQVCDGKPALGFFYQAEDGIRDNFIGDQRLIHSQPGHWQRIGCQIIACAPRHQSVLSGFPSPMKLLHKVIVLGALACAVASCESPLPRSTQGPQMRPATLTGARRIANVRTTAYTHTERGGRKN